MKYIYLFLFFIYIYVIINTLVKIYTKKILSVHKILNIDIPLIIIVYLLPFIVNYYCFNSNGIYFNIHYISFLLFDLICNITVIVGEILMIRDNNRKTKLYLLWFIFLCFINIMPICFIRR